jgi:transposase
MIPARMAIYVATERLDLRRSFDGLAGVVREVLREDPLSGALFMFFNKAADRVKILWWGAPGVTWSRGKGRYDGTLKPRVDAQRVRVPTDRSQARQVGKRVLHGVG